MLKTTNIDIKKGKEDKKALFEPPELQSSSVQMQVKPRSRFFSNFLSF